MATTTCPECRTEGEGRFCSHCGTPLAAVRCSACGATLAAGSRFCSQCGAEVGGGSAGGAPGAAAAGGAGGDGGDGAHVAWIVAGIALVALIVVLGLPVLRQETPPPPAGSPPAAGGMPDLESMSPREAADRLFNRVMQANAAGDSAEVGQFLPMAIRAYEMVGELDADGHYHLSVLQATSGDHAAALATAEEVLADDPDHLLALAAAADAAAALGREDEAREHHARFVEVYDAERERALPEYEAHSALLPDLLEEARGHLEEGG